MAKEGWCKNRCALAMKQWVVSRVQKKSKTDNFWTVNHTLAYQYHKIGTAHIFLLALWK